MPATIGHEQYHEQLPPSDVGAATPRGYGSSDKTAPEGGRSALDVAIGFMEEYAEVFEELAR